LDFDKNLAILANMEILLNRVLFTLKKDEEVNFKLPRAVVPDNLKFQVEYDWRKYITEDVGIHFSLWKNYWQNKAARHVFLEQQGITGFCIDGDDFYDHLQITAGCDVIIALNIVEQQNVGITRL